MKNVFLFIGLVVLFIQGSAHQNVQEYIIPTDGAELYCQVVGTGEPILLIQGGPGLPYDFWTKALSPLTQRHSLIYFYHRGSYLSKGEISKESMQFDTFVEDVEAIRKALDITKMNLIGDCWGAGIAMKYAIKYSEHVGKMVLLNTMPPSFEELMLYGLEVKWRTDPYRKELKELQKTKDFQLGNLDVLTRIRELYLRPHLYDPETAFALASRQILSVEAMSDMVKMKDAFAIGECSKSYNWYNQLEDINLPTLIMAGDSDWIPISMNEKIHKIIKGSKLIIVKNCGHIMIFDKTDEVLKSLEDFFN